MTLQEKQAHLRKLVYTHIYPDGIPLEFGCEVKGAFSVKTYLYEDDHFFYLKAKHIAENSHTIDRVGKSVELEILGPKLSLQDLLRAIKQNGKRMNVNEKGRCRFDPPIVYVGCKAKGTDTATQIALDFDLTKSPEQQSEEVVDKLIELLN